jgi:hypothetical protein
MSQTKNPEVIGCPPSRLAAADVPEYYWLLGALEAFYFELCEEDSAKYETKRWQSLHRKLADFERQVLLFNDRSANATACGEVLLRNLQISRRLLWLDEDSADASLSYIIEEGKDCSSYNENHWFGEPYYWEDEIGTALNELVAILLDDSDERAIRPIVDSIDYFNQRRQSSCNEWLAFMRTLFSQKCVTDIEDTIERSTISTNNFIATIDVGRPLPLVALIDFAEQRNRNCMRFAKCLLSLENLSNRREARHEVLH